MGKCAQLHIVHCEADQMSGIPFFFAFSQCSSLVPEVAQSDTDVFGQYPVIPS